MKHFIVSLIFMACVVTLVSARPHVNEELVAHTTMKWKRWQEKQLQLQDNPTWQHGENKYSIQRPEGARNFYVYIPKSYQNTSSMPLLFGFHGLGDTCENFGEATGFKELAELNNFIYVYPCGSSGWMGTGWNSGTCCVSNVDDVAFSRGIVDFTRKSLGLGISTVWSAGFSNGAMMSERLACEMNDEVSAIVSVSGIVCVPPGNADGLAACTKSFSAANSSVSILLIHGDNDWVVPWTGDAILGFPDVPDGFTAWAQRNQCSGQPANTFSSGTFSNQVYKACSSNVRLELVKNSGGGHAWPENSNFNTTEYAMKFLLKQLN